MCVGKQRHFDTATTVVLRMTKVYYASNILNTVGCQQKKRATDVVLGLTTVNVVMRMRMRMRMNQCQI
jgi:ABC-type thiamine transport system substrate-binding protein